MLNFSKNNSSTIVDELFLDYHICIAIAAFYYIYKRLESEDQ